MGSPASHNLLVLHRSAQVEWKIEDRKGYVLVGLHCSLHRSIATQRYLKPWDTDLTSYRRSGFRRLYAILLPYKKIKKRRGVSIREWHWRLIRRHRRLRSFESTIPTPVRQKYR